jgi:hypothetical protein
MATIKDYMKSARECEKQLWKMCKDRSQNHRKCVLPRCCGICHEIRNCDGVCIYLKKRFKEDLG